MKNPTSLRDRIEHDRVSDASRWDMAQRCEEAEKAVGDRVVPLDELDVLQVERLRKRATRRSDVDERAIFLERARLEQQVRQSESREGLNGERSACVKQVEEY